MANTPRIPSGRASMASLPGLQMVSVRGPELFTSCRSFMTQKPQTIDPAHEFLNRMTAVLYTLCRDKPGLEGVFPNLRGIGLSVKARAVGRHGALRPPAADPVRRPGPGPRERSAPGPSCRFRRTHAFSATSSKRASPSRAGAASCSYTPSHGRYRNTPPRPGRIGMDNSRRIRPIPRPIVGRDRPEVAALRSWFGRGRVNTAARVSSTAILAEPSRSLQLHDLPFSGEFVDHDAGQEGFGRMARGRDRARMRLKLQRQVARGG